MQQADLNALCDQFLPIVVRELGHCIRNMNSYREIRGDKPPKLRIEGSVEFESDSPMATVCLLMLELAAPMGQPKPSLSTQELKDFMFALDHYCGYEPVEGDEIEVGGKIWCLGDGDDGGAIGFRDGKFWIWLRHFKGEGSSNVE